MQQAGNDNEKQRENRFLAVAHKSRSLQSSALVAKPDLEEADFHTAVVMLKWLHASGVCPLPCHQ